MVRQRQLHVEALVHLGRVGTVTVLLGDVGAGFAVDLPVGGAVVVETGGVDMVEAHAVADHEDDVARFFTGVGQCRGCEARGAGDSQDSDPAEVPAG